MMNTIHPSAVIEDGARLGAGVEIGPFCHVGSQAKLGGGVRLISHVSVAGDTSVGARTVIYPSASIGHPPQDLKYRGEPVRLTIGEGCLIREGVTMNPGTAGGGSGTSGGPRAAARKQALDRGRCFWPMLMSLMIVALARASFFPTT